MKFRKVMSSIGSIKNEDFYDFKFTKEQIEEGMKRDYTNPFIFLLNGEPFSLFNSNGKLRVNLFVSYYGFEEGFGEHKPKVWDNCIRCSCGKKFPQGKMKKGFENFNKHLAEIEELKKESKVEQ